MLVNAALCRRAWDIFWSYHLGNAYPAFSRRSPCGFTETPLHLTELTDVSEGIGSQSLDHQEDLPDTKNAGDSG
jgi:hypothetical protein